MIPTVTVTVWVDAADRVTASVTVLALPLLPSVTDTSAMLTDGSGLVTVLVTVTSWSRLVWFPKTSVAVQVIVVMPTANRLPAGTPVRDTTTPGTLSVAVAVPRVMSLRYTDAPPVVVRVMLAGTVKVGATRSGELDT